jgi:AcrR family transcriptional regulator
MMDRVTDEPQHRSRRERATRRRDEIVAAAAALFARHGYRGTGLAEIAAQVGITQAGVLYHFGSKDGLLRAVIEHRDVNSEMFAIELLGDTSTALRRLPEFARRNKAHVELAKLFTVLVAESIEEQAPSHGHFVQRYRAMCAVTADIIRKSQREGYVRDDLDPDAKAVEIIATLDGLQIQWLLDPDRVDIVSAVETYCAALAEQLASRTASR